jgi:hypothetical protein
MEDRNKFYSATSLFLKMTRHCAFYSTQKTLQIYNDVEMMLILGATLAVDTFFLLAGVLMSYLVSILLHFTLKSFLTIIVLRNMDKKSPRNYIETKKLSFKKEQN